MHSLSAQLIGRPTVLLEYAGLRWLTDPALSPPGHYGWLEETAGPALDTEQLEPIDVVPLSHDQHPDNLDPAGRSFLPRASRVLTTTGGAQRLGASAIDIAPRTSAEVPAPEGRTITVTAVPAQHLADTEARPRYPSGRSPHSSEISARAQRWRTWCGSATAVIGGRRRFGNFWREGDASERTATAATEEWFTGWPFTGGRATVRMAS
jgi:L-ascorbate metabolism protein UlaG (beta-lactamase superfamily)